MAEWPQSGSMTSSQGRGFLSSLRIPFDSSKKCSMYDRRSAVSCRIAIVALMAFTEMWVAFASTDCGACSREIVELGSAEVCGIDGLTYMRACLANCQDVAIAYHGICRDGSTAAADADAADLTAVGSTAPGSDSTGAAAAATTPPPELDAATITAYAKEGLRCVGYMARTTFNPEAPAISTKRAKALQRKQHEMGATMMVTAQGVLYAAPHNKQQLVPATSDVRTDGSELQQAHLATSSTVAPFGRRLLRTQLAASMQAVRGARRLLGGAAYQAVGSIWDAANTGRRLKAIFGDDTRREIPLTPTDALYTPVGHILFTSATTAVRYQCTGSMIGPYTVLTAAHCLVDRAGNMQANIEFTPAQTYRNQTGLGTATGVRIYFNKDYLGENWEMYDVGVLVLDRPFGVHTRQDYDKEIMSQLQVTPENVDGPAPGGLDASVLRQYQLPAWPAKRFGYASGTERLMNVRMFSAGYPGDKKFNSFWRFACKISEPAGPVGPIVVNYCPTASGQSGAPLIEVRNTKQGTQRLVRALISFEMCESICDGRCCNGVVKYNGALRITPTVKAFIDQYVDQRPDGVGTGAP